MDRRSFAAFRVVSELRRGDPSRVLDLRTVEDVLPGEEPAYALSLLDVTLCSDGGDNTSLLSLDARSAQATRGGLLVCNSIRGACNKTGPQRLHTFLDAISSSCARAPSLLGSLFTSKWLRGWVRSKPQA